MLPKGKCHGKSTGGCEREKNFRYDTIMLVVGNLDEHVAFIACLKPELNASFIFLKCVCNSFRTY